MIHFEDWKKMKSEIRRSFQFGCFDFDFNKILLMRNLLLSKIHFFYQIFILNTSVTFKVSLLLNLTFLFYKVS